MLKRPLSRVLLLLLAAVGCGDAEDLSPAEETAGIIITPPPPSNPVAELMVWTNTASIDIWRLSGRSNWLSTKSLSRPSSSWWASGVAGNRLLLQNAATGAAELYELDSSHNVVGVATLAQPRAGDRATGLSVKLPSATGCWSRADSQEYWLTWDNPDGVATYQRIRGDGTVLESQEVTKPEDAAALWFGLGADDQPRALYRTGVSVYYANVFGATDSPPALGALEYTHRVPSHRPSAMDRKRLTSIITGAVTEDRILFTETYGAGTAKLVGFDAAGTFLFERSYTGASGGYATAFTWLPPVCP